MTRLKPQPDYFCVSAVALDGTHVVYGPFRSSMAAYAWADAEPAIQPNWLVQRLIEPRVLEVGVDVG